MSISPELESTNVDIDFPFFDIGILVDMDRSADLGPFGLILSVFFGGVFCRSEQNSGTKRTIVVIIQLDQPDGGLDPE